MNFFTQSEMADRMMDERRRQGWRLKAWAWFKHMHVRQDFPDCTALELR